MHKELKYEHGGVTFHIRGAATRGDQYEMHEAMASGAEIKDGKIASVSPVRLFPWLIERFVIGWSLSEPFSLKALMEQPAEPGEDLILILGSYILNHTGMVATPEVAERKNG